jgi:hypothetical protein
MKTRARSEETRLRQAFLAKRLVRKSRKNLHCLRTAYRQPADGTGIFRRSMMQRDAIEKIFAKPMTFGNAPARQKNSARLVKVLHWRTLQQNRNTCAPATSPERCRR